jgi:hypothetical protein
MVLLNVTALMIYDLTGRFGPFHVAAIISLATVAAGYLPAFRRRPRGAWVPLHATLMAWSYVGLVAAFASEILTRLPGFGFWPAVFAATAAVLIGGAILIHTRLPGALRPYARSRAG